jgi:uncharacterized protein involved in exopolysaccharide biosynthesis
MKQANNRNYRAHPLQGLFDHKLLIVSILLVVVMAGMGATFLITPKYEATMSILVSRDRIDPQITSSDKTVDITQTAISDEEFNSELELFKSVEVVTSVVREMDLVNNRKPKLSGQIGEWRGKIKTFVYGLAPGRSTEKEQPEREQSLDVSLEKTVNEVYDSLDVVPIKKSRVIKVTYTDTDPVRAKKTLEAVYRKFVDLHVQLNEKPEAAQVFNEQTAKFDQKLNEATEKLKDFDSNNGVIGADINTQQGLLQKQLADAQTQTDATRTEIGETIRKIASLQSKVAAEPEQIQTGYVSKYVPAVDRMKEELSQLEQQRTQLLQKYQPTSRFVRDNQGRIDQLKQSLAAETANPPQERSFALNELRRKLEAELHSAQIALSALKEREKAVSAQTAKLSAEVTSLNIKSIERTGLERKRSVNEEAYLLYQKKARENEIGQVLTKEQVMNFAIVDPPRTDGEQKSPKTVLNLLVLLVVGTMAGLAGAIIYDRLTDPDNDLIRANGEIEGRLNLPLLANIQHRELPEAVEIRYAPHRRALPPARLDRWETDLN